MGGTCEDSIMVGVRTASSFWYGPEWSKFLAMGIVQLSSNIPSWVEYYASNNINAIKNARLLYSAYLRHKSSIFHMLPKSTLNIL